MHHFLGKVTTLNPDQLFKHSWGAMVGGEGCAIKANLKRNKILSLAFLISKTISETLKTYAEVYRFITYMAIVCSMYSRSLYFWLGFKERQIRLAASTS